MNTRFAFAGAVIALITACSVTSTTPNPGGPGGPGGGGASADQIAGCKQSCDKMKFFQCSSADEQAACYSDCDSATPSQIQVFTGCANNSVCDPACRTNITPKADGGSSSGGGGGASASSCGTACDKLVSCSLIHVGDKDACVTECTKSAYQYQIDCAINTACDKIAATCGSVQDTGGGSGGSSGGTSSGGTSGGLPDSGLDDQFDIQQCQTACDNLFFFTCFAAQDQSTCRTLCTTATKDKRDTFKACDDGAGGDCTKGQACWTTFQN